MRVRPPSFPIILIMALIPGAGVYAQSFSGTVRGTATDSSGAILPNVKVTLINESTGESRTQPTSDLGTYTFPQVAPGLYRLEGEAHGFKKFVHPHITVELQQEAADDLAMQVGEVSESIEVAGEVPLLQPRENG